MLLGLYATTTTTTATTITTGITTKLIIYFLILIKIIHTQNPSPCPKIFNYETNKKEQDRWYGVLTISSNEELKGIRVTITLDRPAELLGNWFGDTDSSDNQEYNIRNLKYKLEAGPPIQIRFFVKYNSATIIPSLKSVDLNGKTICSYNKMDTLTTTPRLHLSENDQIIITRRPINGLNNNEDNEPIGFITRPRLPNLKTTTTTTKPQISPLDGDGDFFGGDFSVVTTVSRPTIHQPRPGRNVACGTVAMRPNALISHGQKTEKGQWPWHVALYHSQSGLHLMYTCGGTLITENHVITAAHCVTKPLTNQVINPQNIIAYLGKYNLKTFGPEVQDREISEIFIHPQYNNSVYFNDLAILKLSESVNFNNYVRPCCLWNEDTELEHIHNKLGTVVGWGFDENRRLSTHLMQAQMPVVSTIKCIYSNREFFSQFTFEKTYCAGFRNGTSVCNGDSGGGMVFPTQDSNGQITWSLRGLVSVGVALQGRGVCDTSHYIVFTDVAQHLDWINKILGQ